MIKELNFLMRSPRLTNGSMMSLGKQASPIFLLSSLAGFKMAAIPLTLHLYDRQKENKGKVGKEVLSVSSVYITLTRIIT